MDQVDITYVYTQDKSLKHMRNVQASADHAAQPPKEERSMFIILWYFSLGETYTQGNTEYKNTWEAKPPETKKPHISPKQ